MQEQQPLYPAVAQPVSTSRQSVVRVARQRGEKTCSRQFMGEGVPELWPGMAICLPADCRWDEATAAGVTLPLWNFDTELLSFLNLGLVTIDSSSSPKLSNAAVLGFVLSFL